MSFVESAISALDTKLDSSENDNLFKMKKELADEIVNKLSEKTNDPMLLLWQETVTNYLVSEWFFDDLGDNFWMGLLLKTGITSQGKALEKYRERINDPEKQTESDIVALKNEILQEINWIDPQVQGQQEAPWSSNWEQQSPQLRPTIDVSQWIRVVYDQLEWKEKPDFVPFSCAMQWYEKKMNELWNPTYLTVVDFSKSNKTNRMFVINMVTKKVEYAVPVGHWKNSWWEYATKFSDKTWTNQSSLGFFRTPQEITKAHTKSWHGLWMKGIEDSNDNAHNRWIYMHPWTVTWSAWCFTLPKYSKEIMEKLKWDSLLFAYYPQQDYFAESKLIDSKPDRLVA